MSFDIAFVPFPDFEELDFVGPYEALAATAKRLLKEAGFRSLISNPRRRLTAQRAYVDNACIDG